jgi:hypothetical protein
MTNNPSGSPIPDEPEEMKREPNAKEDSRPVNPGTKTEADHGDPPPKADAQREPDEYQNALLEQNAKTLRINRQTLIANAAINGTLSLATIFLAWYTSSLAISTKELRDFSEKQIGLAQDNFKKQIRAYLVVESAVITESTDSADPNLSVRLKNVGQTPAYDVFSFRRAVMSPILDGKVMPDGAYITDCADKEGQGAAAIGAGLSMGYDIPRMRRGTANQYTERFSEMEMAEFKQGKSVYYIRGISCYQDIFKDRHFTKFCFFFQNPKSFETHGFISCDIENDAD